MTLRLKVGRKGYIILPKIVRDMVGIEEGDEVVVEVGDGISLKPDRKVDAKKLRVALEGHLNRITQITGTTEPEAGELAGTYLEEEFEG